MMRAGVFLVPLLFSYGLLSAQPQAQDAAALEAQYKTCAKHYIPADKCTSEIYQQLKATDEAPPDTKTAAALRSAKEYRAGLKNPESMQIHSAYVTDKGDVCPEIGGQNGAGGMTVSRVVYTAKARWLDEGGFAGAFLQEHQHVGGGVDRWDGYCEKGTFHKKLVPGTDVTEKVKQALKDDK
jgi:hypothetical protein